MPTIDPTKAKTAAIRTERDPDDDKDAGQDAVEEEQLADAAEDRVHDRHRVGVPRGVRARPQGGLHVRAAGHRSRGCDTHPEPPVRHVQSGDQEQQGDGVERQGEWGHPQHSDEHGCQRTHQHRGGSAQHDDPHDDEDVPGGGQERCQRQPDENAVESVQPGVDEATIDTQRVCGESRRDDAERPGEADPRVKDPHGRQDEQAGDRAVHKHDLPDSAQAVLEESHHGYVVRLLAERRHRAVHHS